MKVAGYEINIQKSVMFLYTNNEIEKVKKKSCLKSHQKKKMQNIEINLTKGVKDLYAEN